MHDYLIHLSSYSQTLQTQTITVAEAHSCLTTLPDSAHKTQKQVSE